MRFRLLNHLRAWWGGYFWLPCPICAKKFGGHEWRDINGRSSIVYVSPGSGRGICPECTLAGRGEWQYVVDRGEWPYRA